VAAVVAERLGHPADTALTLGWVVAGKARSIGPRGAQTPIATLTPPRLACNTSRAGAPSGPTIRLLPTADGELRAAECDQPLNPMGFGVTSSARSVPLDEVQAAMRCCGRNEPADR